MRFMITNNLKSHSDLEESQRDHSHVINNLLRFKNFYTKRNFDIVKLFATGRELEFKSRFSSTLASLTVDQPTSPE